MQQSKQTSRAGNQGSVLIGLLWCMVLLSIVVIGFLHTTRMDLQVGKNYGDRIQAHYLALAGIEKTKALLYRDASQRSRNGKSHDGQLYNAPDQFRDIQFGRGTFMIFKRGRDDQGGGVIYGISDEESRLNVNTASAEELGKINGLTPDVAAAIQDWRDGDNQVTPGGAEADYYLALQPPYKPRNGPLPTIRELLMVRGISRELLFANDTHDNGLLDADEENGREFFLNNQASDADLGWAGMLTVASTDKNVNAQGEDRVNIQNADQASLAGVRGITSEIANAIISYRGRTRFQSIADLLDVTPASGSTNNANGGQFGVPQSSGSRGSGRHVISPELLMDIADDVTVDSDQSKTGLINVNTAGLDVLACLPGVDRQLAQAIISYRESSGYFANIAGLLNVPGMSPDLFKQVATQFTARSETYRILSEGRITSDGVRQRIETIVHIGLSDVSTLAYREDDL